MKCVFGKAESDNRNIYRFGTGVLTLTIFIFCLWWTIRQNSLTNWKKGQLTVAGSGL